MSRLRAGALLAGLTITAAACGQGNVFSLDVGTCFDDQDLEATEVTDVPVVDCAEPHDNEVYHVFDLAGSVYPGQAAVEEQSADGCLAAFDDFVGTPYLDSELDYFPIFPTEDSWDQLDDREVICAVYDLSLEKLTGTAEGIGR